MHTDTQAGSLAKTVQAKAFTIGRDIFFGTGQYAPGRSDSRNLLAHELTHTIQQVGGFAQSLRQDVLQRQGPAVEKTTLEKLDAELNEYWPDDKDILALLGQLNSTERETVLKGYRDKLVRQLSDETMFMALDTLRADCETRKDWLKAEGVKLEYLGLAEDFLESADGGCSLDQELKKRIFDLCECLIALRLVESEQFNATSGCRTKAKAHRLSTGYHIVHDYVTLKDLKSYLPAGPGEPGNEVRDLDGNLWYVRGWTVEETKANARKIYVDSGGTPDIPLAYEGYKVGDPYRNPNTQNESMPIVSAHVYGQAIDLTRHMPWKKDKWDPEHDAVIRSYLLVRPIDSSSPYGPSAAEFWHYEKLSASPGKQPAPGPGREPSPKKPAVSHEWVTNTESVRLVRDPLQWDNDDLLIERLSKGITVEVLDKGSGEPFNRTAEAYQWWKVRTNGMEGWVMQVLLDEVTGGP